MPSVDVLIPTCNRPTALAVTLSGIASQTCAPSRVVISDQSEQSYLECPELVAIYRVLAARGIDLTRHHHLPRRGLAEQRAFLLAQSQADYLWYLDDDCLAGPPVLERLVHVIEQERCGFVGAFPYGLSYTEDLRPHEQSIEFWDGPVQPETLVPGEGAWWRHRVHNAANLYHVAQSLPAGELRRYKVAWIGASVLYNRQKLLQIGGFGFWPELPPEHAGEDVLVQLRLLRRFGGCGIVPSDVYHLELPTTVTDRRYNAVHLLEWSSVDAGGSPR